jgi:hypothetical protein
VSAYAKGDAVRLLRAIDVEQAHGRVGASVRALGGASARHGALRGGVVAPGVGGGADGGRARPDGGRRDAAIRAGAVPFGPGGHAHVGKGIGSYSPKCVEGVFSEVHLARVGPCSSTPRPAHCR